MKSEQEILDLLKKLNDVLRTDAVNSRSSGYLDNDDRHILGTYRRFINEFVRPFVAENYKHWESDETARDAIYAPLFNFMQWFRESAYSVYEVVIYRIGHYFYHAMTDYKEFENPAMGPAAFMLEPRSSEDLEKNKSILSDEQTTEIMRLLKYFLNGDEFPEGCIHIFK